MTLEKIINTAYHFYENNIDCFDEKYDQTAKFLSLQSFILSKRKGIDVSYLIGCIEKYFPEYSIRDTTYLYRDNPSIRINFVNKEKSFSLMVSVLEKIFNITGKD